MYERSKDEELLTDIIKALKLLLLGIYTNKISLSKIDHDTFLLLGLLSECQILIRRLEAEAIRLQSQEADLTDEASRKEWSKTQEHLLQEALKAIHSLAEKLNDHDEPLVTAVQIANTIALSLQTHTHRAVLQAFNKAAAVVAQALGVNPVSLSDIRIEGDTITLNMVVAESLISFTIKHHTTDDGQPVIDVDCDMEANVVNKHDYAIPWATAIVTAQHLSSSNAIKQLADRFDTISQPTAPKIGLRASVYDAIPTVLKKYPALGTILEPSSVCLTAKDHKKPAQSSPQSACAFYGHSTAPCTPSATHSPVAARG